MTPASQLGRPRSVYVIESRACHVTSHRVFVWGYTAFDTLSTLFTLGVTLRHVYGTTDCDRVLRLCCWLCAFEARSR